MSASAAPPSPSPRVLVTRPMHGAAGWVRQLGAAGIAAEALPLIEIAPEPLTGELLQARERLPTYDVAMFVSGNAVAGFFQSNQPVAISSQALAAMNTRAWSPGPGTTEALQAAGWPLSRIDAPAPDAGQFDSESLWTQVSPQVRPGLRVLIVRGGDAVGRVAGRDWLLRKLQAAGAQVDQVVAYRRLVPVLTPAQRARAVAAASDGSGWLFSSREAVDNLRQNLPGVDWCAARAWVTHPRIAQAAQDAGFGHVRQTRPALADVVASIKSAP